MAQLSGTFNYLKTRPFDDRSSIQKGEHKMAAKIYHLKSSPYFQWLSSWTILYIKKIFQKSTA
jgi:hypothetical protein